MKVSLELSYVGGEKVEKLVDFILDQFIYKFCLLNTSYERLQFTIIIRLSLKECARKEENSTTPKRSLVALAGASYTVHILRMFH